MPLAQAAAERLIQQRRTPDGAPLTILEPLEDGSAPTVQDVAFRLQDDYVGAAPVDDGATAVQVSAESTSPAEAETIANVYADAFVDLTLRQSRSGITRSREFLAEQLEDQGEELRRRDADVQGFIEQTGAVALDTETEQTVQAIGDLEGQIGALDVEEQTARARLATLRGELARLEPVLSQRLGSGLDAELEAAQERVQEIEAELEAIYTRTPEYRAAPSSTDPELGRLRGQLEQAQGRVRAVADRLARQSLDSGSGPGQQGAGFTRAATLRTQITDAEVALSETRAQRAQLASQLGQAEAELGQIPSQQIALAQLQRDRQAAESLYGALQANYQEVQVAEQSQIGIGRVIRPAYASDDPVAPNRTRNALLALVLGLGMGGLLAIAKVRLDHRLHVPDDVTSLGYPLIATVPDTGDLIARDFGGAATTAVGGARDRHPRGDAAQPDGDGQRVLPGAAHGRPV